MTVTNTAYQTSPLSGYVMGKIENDIKERFALGRLINVTDNVWTIPPVDYDATAGTIGAFNYPVVFDNRGELNVVFDGRTSMSIDSFHRIVPRRVDELTAKIISARLALEWANGERQRLYSFNAIPAGVFGSWMAEVIAKRFALNAMSQLKVGILASIYYGNLFTDKQRDESDIISDVVYISRVTGFNASEIKNALQVYPDINSLEHFCEACREYTQDVHLRDLNLTTLYGVVGGYWYGNAGRESIAVALEFPPMWLTLLFQAITDRSFKKAGLTQVVERNTWRKHADSFVRAMMPRAEVSGSSALKM